MVQVAQVAQELLKGNSTGMMSLVGHLVGLADLAEHQVVDKGGQPVLLMGVRYSRKE